MIYTYILIQRLLLKLTRILVYVTHVVQLSHVLAIPFLRRKTDQIAAACYSDA